MKKPAYKVERGVMIKRSQLSNNDYNPNKTSERQQQAIAESLNNYGQLTAVLVRPDPKEEGKYIIIDGEHRSAVLDKELYVDVVYDLSEADAKKLTVIMNETRGAADKIELAHLLASIQEELGGFEELQIGLPYDESELQELIDLAEVDWDNFSEDDSSSFGEDEEEEDWTIISCRVPNETLEVINSAIALIKQEKKLHQDKAIANGQILEILAAEYLAIPIHEQDL